MINIRLLRLPLENDQKLKSQNQIAVKKMTTLIWRNLVTMSVKLESIEMFISPQEICKENTTKEVPGLKYLIKLFQNQKLESELNDSKAFS